MSDRNKISIRVFVLCLSLIVIDTFGFSYIYLNGSTGVYTCNTQPPGIPGIQNKITMEFSVSEVAGYFLKTQSKIKNLLDQVEIQDIKPIDYILLNHTIRSALKNISQARITFEGFIKVAEVTPYNLYVLEQLNKFDYDSFMKEYELNPFIFGIVREYCVRGDITGAFKYSYERFKAVEQLLLNIDSSISQNRLPDLDIFWKVNELCAEETLFGSYIARIFKELK